MNIFEEVKSGVTVLQAAEYYGIKPDTKKMVKCPFHNDNNPSMKLNKNYYYCFGCGATGDVIELASRLFNIKPYDAVKKLCSDFGIDRSDTNFCVSVVTHYPADNVLSQDELRCQRVLNEYLRLLNYWMYEYVPKSPDDKLDERFTEACHMRDYVEYVSALIAVSETKLRAKAIASLLNSGTIEMIERRLEEHLKEDINGRKCVC